MAEHSKTDRERLETLEQKAFRLETWLKVTFAIAGVFGLSGAYLFNRAEDLAKKYDALSHQQETLANKQVGLENRWAKLKTEVDDMAVVAVNKAAPAALRSEMDKFVRYDDTAFIEFTEQGRMLSDAGDRVYGSPPAGGQDQKLKVVRQVIPK